MKGFIPKRHNDISVDMWIRKEQMTGALAQIWLLALHLMILYAGFHVCLNLIAYVQ